MTSNVATFDFTCGMLEKNAPTKKGFFMKNKYTSIVIIVFLIFVTPCNCSMNDINKNQKNILWQMEESKAFHDQKQKLNFLVTSVVNNEQCFIDHVCSNYPPDQAALHNALCMSIIPDGRNHPNNRLSNIFYSMLGRGTLYLINRWHAPVYLKKNPIPQEPITPDKKICDGSLFSMHLCRLILMPPSDLMEPIKTPTGKIGQDIITCLLETAKKQSLTPEELTDFTRIHTKYFFGPTANAIISPYKALILMCTHTSKHENDTELLGAKIDFLFSLFKTFLRFIPFDASADLAKQQKEAPFLASWSHYYEKNHLLRTFNKLHLADETYYD
jgi:hypothetical protein